MYMQGECVYTMVEILEKINHFVWGIPALILILGVGFYLSIRTGFAQITLLPKAFYSFFARLFHRNQNNGGVSSFQALCTALAATVGTGNIVGVAGAIAIGGPGSIFWMWICGILGMITKYAEATLAVNFQVRNSKGENVGGPMYIISQGMPKRWHWLSGLYSFFGVVAAFGVGNATQINAVTNSVNSVFVAFGGTETMIGNLGIGIILSGLITILLLGGAKKIGEVAERLVPFAAVLYLLLGIGVLWIRRFFIWDAFVAIIEGAFSPKAVTGGALGSGFVALRIGASRGVFTNEAGMGTAAIAHGAAKADHPACQGLMGIMEVFLDTIVICTMTALVILSSGIPIPYGTDAGGALTSQAFSTVLGDWVCVPIAIAMCCFAVATVLGWGLYGARCAQYLFGEDVWKKFVLLQAVTVIAGAVLNTGTVWLLSETVNGLMAVPNLFMLAWLSPVVIKLTKEYKNREYSDKIVDNFDDCDKINKKQMRCGNEKDILH